MIDDEQRHVFGARPEFLTTPPIFADNKRVPLPFRGYVVIVNTRMIKITVQAHLGSLGVRISGRSAQSHLIHILFAFNRLETNNLIIGQIRQVLLRVEGKACQVKLQLHRPVRFSDFDHLVANLDILDKLTDAGNGIDAHRMNWLFISRVVAHIEKHSGKLIRLLRFEPAADLIVLVFVYFHQFRTPGRANTEHLEGGASRVSVIGNQLKMPNPLLLLFWGLSVPCGNQVWRLSRRRCHEEQKAGQQGKSSCEDWRGVRSWSFHGWGSGSFCSTGANLSRNSTDTVAA